MMQPSKPIFLRFLALLLILMLLGLCACAPQQDYPEQLAPSPKQIPSSSQSENGSTFTADLFFLTPTSNALSKETQSIPIHQGQSRAEALVQALCAGPVAEALYLPVIPDTLKLESVALSGNVCLIYFSGEVDVLQLLIVRAALAATLCQQEHVEYIDVYVNDTQPGYNDRPFGAMQPITEDLASYLVSMQQEYAITEYTSSVVLYENRNAVLYYTDSTAQLLLCEVRQFLYTRNMAMPSIVNALITEWSRGPMANTGCQPLLPEGMVLTSSPVIMGIDRSSGKILPNQSEDTNENDDDPQNATSLLPGATITDTGAPNPLLEAGLDQIVELRFSKPSADYDEALVYAGLVNTITGFCPNIYGVRILVGEDLIQPADLVVCHETRDYFIRSDFADLLGETIYLACPSVETGDLHTVLRCVPQSIAYRPEVRLKQLLNTNLLLPLTTQDVLEVYVVNDTAIVNWAKGFTDKFSQYLNSDASGASLAALERVFVYSLVNTMTELDGVEKIWMLENGSFIEDAPGMIYLGNALLRNPGLQVN